MPSASQAVAIVEANKMDPKSQQEVISQGQLLLQQAMQIYKYGHDLLNKVNGSLIEIPWLVHACICLKPRSS